MAGGVGGAEGVRCTGDPVEQRPLPALYPLLPAGAMALLLLLPLPRRARPPAARRSATAVTYPRARILFSGPAAEAFVSASVPGSQDFRCHAKQFFEITAFPGHPVSPGIRQSAFIHFFLIHIIFFVYFLMFLLRL